MTTTGTRKYSRYCGIRLPQGAERLLSAAILIFDALLMNALFIGVFTLWFSGLQQAELYLNAYLQVRWILLALYISFGMLAGIFNIRNLSAASDIFSHTSNALLGTFISFNLIAFFSRDIATLAYNFPRPVFLLATVCCVIAAVMLRAVVSTLFRPHPLIRRAVIIGDESEARRIIKHFHRRGGVRFRIVHCMHPDQIDDLAAEVIFRHAHEVFVTDPSLDLDKFWAQIFYQRKEEPHQFKVRISADYRKTSGTVALQSLEDFPLITLHSHPLTGFQRFCKRTFDVTFSLFALAVASPVMLLTAVLVRLDSPGPLFYKQKRVGRYGKEFDVIKFRSMLDKGLNLLLDI